MSVLSGFFSWVSGKKRRKEALEAKAEPLPQMTLNKGDVRETRGGVGIASYKGKRPYQEDRFFVMDGLDIGSANAKSFLAGIFNKAAETTEELVPGSTATGVVLTKDLQLNAAFLGDSPVVIFVHDPETREVTAQQISRNHSPALADERERIKAAGGTVNKENRLVSINEAGTRLSSYAVSRAFGDDKATGMSREPEFASFDIKKEIDAGKNVYVVVSSDGLYDGTRLGQYIRTVKRAIAEGREDDLPEFFSGRAYLRGSKDNITALVYKVPKSLDADLFLSVADGHGGSATSQKVVDTFAEQVVTKLRKPSA